MSQFCASVGSDVAHVFDVNLKGDYVVLLPTKVRKNRDICKYFGVLFRHNSDDVGISRNGWFKDLHIWKKVCIFAVRNSDSAQSVFLT